MQIAAAQRENARKVINWRVVRAVANRQTDD